MKKLICLILIFNFYSNFLFAQGVSIAVERMNVFYLGLDNRITISVWNTDPKDIILKTNNGTISGSLMVYDVSPKQVGLCEIYVYLKKGKRLKKIDTKPYRVYKIPLPIFKIASGKRSQSITEISNQQYVRAEYEGMACDIKVSVDSFTVCSFSKDTCVFKEVMNYTGELSQKVKELLKVLKPEDVVVFKKIYARLPNGEITELEPVMITVY